MFVRAYLLGYDRDFLDAVAPRPHEVPPLRVAIS